MAVTVTDNGDGTATVSGATVTDNGDGTATISGDVLVIDQGNGTALVAPLWEPIPNPNWPQIEEAVGFLNSPSTPLLAYLTLFGSTGLYQPAEGGIWCDITTRTEGSWTSNRGRQYELDQVQAGTVSTTLRNDDGAFDPSNQASPFWPLVKVYRAYRRRAQYPVTVNLLYADTAAGAASSPWAFDLPSWTSPNPAYPIWPLGALGGHNTIPTSIPAGTKVWTIGGFAITPGLTYSGQGICYMYSGSPSLSVAAQFNWYLANGTVTTTTGTPVTCPGGAGTLLTVSGTAPANAVGATLSFVVASPPASTATIEDFAQMQVEQAAAPSNYVVPGTWYDMFTGYVERWPQAWTSGGIYGTTGLKVVDAFGYLSQSAILSPGYMEILADSPSWFWPMDEPTGSTAWLDATGNSLPAALNLVNGGTASQCVAGQQIPASTLWTQTGGYAGSGWALEIVGNGLDPAGVSGPCTQFGNRGNSAGALLDIGTAKGSAGPPSTSGWTMVFLVNTPLYTAGTLPDQTVWAAYDTATGGSNQLAQLRATSNHFYEFDLRPAAGTTYTLSLATGNEYGASTPVAAAHDGDWHLIVITMSADGKTLTGYLDALTPATLTNATDMRPTFPAASSETLGGRASGGSLVNGWSGYLSCVALIPQALPHQSGINLPVAPTGGPLDINDPPSVAALQYTLLLSTNNNPLTTFGIGYVTTETSGMRYRDILRWAAWQGLRSIDNYESGQTQQYGPPLEFLTSMSGGGTDAVSAAQTVVDTENGEHFVDRSGIITFHRRGNRYAQRTPKVTLGEKGQAPAARENLCTNPSLEVDATGWGSTDSTIATSTDHAYVGAQSLKVTPVPIGAHGANGEIDVSTTPGLVYSVSVQVWVPAGTPPVQLFGRPGLPGAIVYSAPSTATGAWQQLTVSVLATGAAIAFGVTNSATITSNTQVWYIDAMIAEQALSVGAYFDGSTPADANYTYAWTGTANESASTATPQPGLIAEVPYMTAGFDYDPTRVADDVQLTQESTGITFRQIDPVAIDDYGDIALQRTLNTISVLEIKDALSFLLLAEANPNLRVTGITVDLAANPWAWPLILALELGVPAQVNRRPPSAPEIGFDGFVEQINWTINDQGAASCSLQLSPNLPLQQDAAVFDTSRFGPEPGAQTVTCTSTATSLSVVTGAGPTLTTAAGAYPFDIMLDAERITITAAPTGSTSPQTVNVTRGVGGTTPAAHTAAALSLALPAEYAY